MIFPFLSDGTIDKQMIKDEGMKNKMSFTGLGRLFVISLSVMTLLTACQKEKEPTPLNLPLKAAQLISSDNSFGLNLFKRILEDGDTDENIMISPLSISQALTMTWNGAEGDTRVGMELAMEMSGLTKDEINDLNRQLVNALLVHDKDVILNIANSIWYRDDFTVLPDFIKVNQDYYSAEVRALDFSDPGTKDVINAWVYDKTNRKIEKIVDEIKPESFMFLINAIYFKGDWRYEFDKKKTYDGDFFLSPEQSVIVPMMTGELNARSFRNELFSAVELPYGKGNWSMFILLPAPDKKVGDIVDQMNEDQWNQWMKDFVDAGEVTVHLPRFTFSYNTSLKDVLIAMGMDLAFSSEADFTGILSEGGILISDVKHKTFVEVNEEGTEAAAVTSVEMELTSVGEYFKVDRPFLFMIAEKSSNTILFAGKVSDPTNTGA